MGHKIGSIAQLLYLKNNRKARKFSAGFSATIKMSKVVAVDTELNKDSLRLRYHY
jgi:hypothetical protein